MVDRLPLVDPRIIKLGRIFTPATPIHDADLFSGRRRLFVRIADAINQIGMHCILFGERGVGKTSLINILAEVIEPAVYSEMTVARINCDTNDDYARLMRKLMQEIITIRETPGIGFGNLASPTQSKVPASDMLPDKPAPNDVLILLQSLPANWLLIVDEFDRLTDTIAIRLMSDTIKVLSDRAVSATFLLVGVATNVDSLLREHRSIERCLAQILMPRMAPEELGEIVSKGLAQVDMEMSESDQWYIPAVSQGYPHYTHLLALHSARETLDRGRDVVERKDIEAAIDEALELTERSIQDNYALAVYSANPHALYRQVLLACALAETDEFGYFNSQDVREPLSHIMGRRYDVPAFARHLDAFCKDGRGPTLIKEGRRRRYRYQFTVPLMRPFIILRGIADGLIQAEVLSDL